MVQQAPPSSIRPTRGWRQVGAVVGALVVGLLLGDVADARPTESPEYRALAEENLELTRELDQAGDDLARAERDAESARRDAQDAAGRAEAAEAAAREVTVREGRLADAELALATREAAVVEREAQVAAAQAVTAQAQTAPAATPAVVQQVPAVSAAYENCTEARAAGAAPVLRGEPGYGPHLDRDDDGVGCE